MTPVGFLNDLLTGYSVGAGKARVGDIQMVEDLLTRPKGVYEDLVAAARALAANPGAVVNALKSGAQHAVSSPTAFGEAVGSFGLPKLGKARGVMSELDVYHGTPHTFDPETGAPLGRFRSEKIGTGEGAQKYGHGLYFAENEKVVTSPQTNYMQNERINLRNTGALTPLQEIISDGIDQGLSKYSIFGKLSDLNYKINKGNFETPLDAFLHEYEKVDSMNTGRLYKVDLPDAKIEQMLDWDNPISQQPGMQKAFSKFWKGLSKNERAQAVLDEFGDYDLAEQMAKNPGEMRGRLAYTLMTHHFGDQAAASEFLRQQGVPGIKYLDASSRIGGNGTRNFVVFPGEEQHLNILERK